jgi:hypothetical protein
MSLKPLIDLSGSPPQSPSTPHHATNLLAQSGWQAIEPDRPRSMWSSASWSNVQRPNDEGDDKSQIDGKVTEQQVPSPSNDQQKISITLSDNKSRVSSTSSSHTQQAPNDPKTPKSVSGKNIPLPDSPFTPHRNDSDTRSITSNETSHSKLSAAAKPFNATPTKRIEVVRTSEPPSFFPSPTDEEDQVQNPDVSPDQMDPAYFQPGFGGQLTTTTDSVAGGGLKSLVWFARPESRAVSITTPEPKVKIEAKVKEEGEKPTRPSTPVTVKTYDGTADSPVSDRHMREPTPQSPSEASIDLPKPDYSSHYVEDDEARPLADPEMDRNPGLDQLTAHFESIRLTPADGPIPIPPSSASGTTSVAASISQDQYAGHDGRQSSHLGSIPLSPTNGPHSIPPHPSSKVNSITGNISLNPYASQDGRLSPQLTGDQSGKEELTDHPESSYEVEQDTTLVSETQLDFTGSLDEGNDLEDAWMKFRDGYGMFSGSIDEALARLKMELSW